MKKAVWFKDFNGVVNPVIHQGKENFFQNFSVWKTVNIGEQVINFSPEIVNFVNEMNKTVEVVWLDHQGDSFVSEIASALGFDTFRVVNTLGTDNPLGRNVESMKEPVEETGMFQKDSELRWWKFNAVMDHVKNDGRDFIWTDDELFSSALKYVKRMAAWEGTDSLLLKIKDDIGLTPSDLNVIRGFVAKHQ